MLRRAIILFLLTLSTASYAKVGLVLSGGGAKGFAHIGVLKMLDKEGIKVDYITGTSMGCIIGALYAIGYSGEDIEKMVLEENWTKLFNDRPIREYIPMYEKDESERYVGAFSLSPGKSFLPTGIMSGQKLYTLFTRLTWNYQNVKDFRKLPIPLACIATNLENGDIIILDKGNIAEAMRASMSIPTIFSPVELDGHLLVDGGIVDNLPIREARKMGADFVIAVDATGPRYKKDEINSFFRVMEQVVTFHTYEKKEKEKKTANVLIDLDTNAYNVTSFDEATALIDTGERSVTPFLEELNKLPKVEKQKSKKKAAIVSFKITSIKIEGLQKASKDFVLGSLDLSLPATVNEKQIESAIERVYGTQFFESVTYNMTPLDNGSFELAIKVKERSSSILRFGFNYSSYTKASLLLNTTFKNTFTADSRVSLDVDLSENPAFRGQYYVYSSKKPGIGLRTELLFNKFNITTFQNGTAQAIYRFSYYDLSVNAETNFSNYMLLGVGVDKEFTTRSPLVSTDQINKSYDEFLTGSFFYKIDTLNSVVYPKKGIQINADFKLATDALSLQDGISHKTFERMSLGTEFAVPFNNRISFIGNTFIGGSVGNNIPYEYQFYFGGFRANYRWFQPFVGLDYMSVSGPNALLLGGAIQIEMLKNIYLILKTNVGKLSSQFTDIFNAKDSLFGNGVTFSWDSLIGPVEVTLMKEIKRNTFAASVSIGYWF